MLYVLASTAQLCALSAQFPLARRALIERSGPWGGTSSRVLENLHWEHPRRPHDFHSSREGAPNPWRSRREARCLDLTVELSAPPADDALWM